MIEKRRTFHSAGIHKRVSEKIGEAFVEEKIRKGGDP
jgi:hypothetical protein